MRRLAMNPHILQRYLYSPRSLNGEINVDKVDVEEAVAHKARVQADAEVDAGMSPPEHLLRGLPLSGWAMHTA